jgi:ribonuclease R
MFKDKKNNDKNKRVISGLIRDIFYANASQIFNYKQLAKRAGVNDDTGRHLIRMTLSDMVKNEDIIEVSTGKYKLNPKTNYIVGKIEATSSNNAFLISDQSPEPVFIAQNNLNHAIHGDTVKVFLFARRKSRHPEGEVVEVISRVRKTFVGMVEISKNFAFLIPDGKAITYDIFIPLDKLNGAQDGQKAVATITEWPRDAKNPFGEIKEVLGFPGHNETEMHAILAEFELPYKFESEVEAAAEAIPDVIPQDEINRRRDFRDITTFTIDPADAKDFDDALSFRRLPDGNIEVGVHIADVTHYVRPHTVLDDEAYERGTSVYLVDRVVPMLPERLSNVLCSLRPNEDKLTFSAVFVLDNNASIVNQWFGKTIINSNRRFSYEEAQNVIETGKGDLSDEILTLNTLAQTLRNKRLSAGAIDFERDEIKFEIDANGKPLRVFYKESKESNKLIEEFMLLANRKVAEVIGKAQGKTKAKTFVYRVHDKPNREKLASFASFITRFGYKISMTSGKKIAESMNSVLATVKGKSEENLISNLALRAMAKAIYTTSNIGHYGLAFDYYTHFTSPIRRYPDMMVHRLLFNYQNGGESANQKKYEDMCEHASVMEQKATDAERASNKYKQVEFMSDKIGNEFDGTISGVTEWGIYVELADNKCEGMIPVRELTDDYYNFDEDNYCLIGKRHGKKFQLGDPIRIKVWRANLLKKQLDFKLAEDE